MSSTKKKSQSGIAVIGLGTTYPGAHSLSHFWENILARRQQFRNFLDIRLPKKSYYSSDRNDKDMMYAKWGAFVDNFDFDWSSRKIPKSSFETADIVHWLALEVAEKTIIDSKINLEKVNRDKFGVILGNSLTGEWTRSYALRLRWPFIKDLLMTSARDKGISEDSLERVAKDMEGLLKGIFPEPTEDTLSGGLANTIAGRVCNYFDLHGGGYIVDGACASSLLALATAAQHIQQGKLDMALAGGVDISLDTLETVGFSRVGALTDKEMTVYDKKASGFIPGEGCGFVLLKNLEQARRDGDYIYAVLKGWGISSDGKGGLTAPNAEGQSRALFEAYEMAGYPISDVHFIEGHGTGTPVGDKVELQGILKTFEKFGGGAPRSCGMTSLKSIVGHTKAAAGVGAFIKAVMGVNQRVLPPTAGCDDPNELFSDPTCEIYPLVRGGFHEPETTLRAGVSAMGFGGINCHVTLESGDSPARHLTPEIDYRSLMSAHDKVEIFSFTAPSQELLRSGIEESLIRVKNLSRAELTDYSRHQNLLSQERQPFCAYVLASKPEELVAKLESCLSLVEKPLKRGELRSDGDSVGVGNVLAPKKLGFLFPGQGSQYINMGRHIVDRYEWARAIMSTVDICNQSVGSRPVTESYFLNEFQVKSSDDLKSIANELKETTLAQSGIAAVSVSYFELLGKLGISPDAVGGHSLGELVSLYACGAYDQETLAKVVAHRGASMASKSNDAGMICVIAGEESSRALLNESGASLTVANINSPRQTILSGSLKEIEKFSDHCLKQKVKTIKLSVSNAFHSPLVESAKNEFHQRCSFLSKSSMGETRIQLFSSVSGDRVGKVNLLGHLSNQITSPVQFQDMVKSMASEVEVFIEVGPGSVLTGLVDDILGEKGRCLPVESTDDKGLSLKKTIGLLFISGHQIRWDVLFHNRVVRPFVDFSKRRFIENPCERLDRGATQENSLPVKKNSRDQGITADPVPAKQSTSKTSVAVAKSPEPAKTFSSQVISVAPQVAVKTAEKSPDVALSTLIEVVCDHTGFERSVVDPDMRLLDDLNLDSIKTAEVLNSYCISLDVDSSALEISKVSNSTLREIAAYVSSHSSHSDNLTGALLSPPVTSEATASSKPVAALDRTFTDLESLGIEKVQAGTQQSGSASGAHRGGTKSASLATLVKIISDLTGFEEGLIDGEMRLLDELNLDSIKASEVVAMYCREIGLDSSEVNPSELANSTLTDIVAFFDSKKSSADHAISSSAEIISDRPVIDLQLSVNSALANGSNDGSSTQMSGDSMATFMEVLRDKTGFDQSMLDPSMRLLDDLNLDSIKAAEVIGSYCSSLGVDASAINPGDLANATLTEVVKAVDSLTPSGQKAAA